MNRAVAGLCVLACGLLAASPAWAKKLVAETFHSDIEVQPDGALRVTETVRFRFQGGPFESVTRTLRRRGADRVEVTGSSDPYTLSETGRGTQVRWTFAPARDAERTFTLEYIARGAVAVHGAERKVTWPLVPPNRKYRIKSATAEVRWPAGWSVTRLRAHRGPVAQTANTATFARRKLGPEAQFQLRARFSSNDALPAPGWQQVRDEQQQHVVTIAWCAGTVLLLGLGLVIAQAREAGVGSSRIEPQRNVQEPPSDAPPALAGAIWRGSSQWSDMVATLVDLARRGHLVIEAEQGKRGRGLGAWTLRRTPLATGLAAWDRIVLDALFPNPDERVVSASRAWTPLSRKKREFETAVQAYLRQRGIYDAHADDSRARLRGSAGVWLGAGAALSVATPFVWRVAGEGTILLPLAPFIVSLVAFALASNISRHSPHGRQSAAAWGGYREFLSKVSSADKPPGDARWFEQHLGYTLALGAGKPWLIAAKKWPPPVPPWFHLPAEGGGGIDAVLSWVASIAGTEAQPTGLAADPALAAILARRHVA